VLACEGLVAAPNAFGAASTAGKTSKGNQRNEESLREPEVQILVFFAAFCKESVLHRRRHACHYSAPSLPFSSMLVAPSTNLMSRMGGTSSSDHVHLFVRGDRNFALATWIGGLKRANL
jgi:hypothetical protein